MTTLKMLELGTKLVKFGGLHPHLFWRHVKLAIARAVQIERRYELVQTLSSS